jgi:hypothetical protein
MKLRNLPQVPHSVGQHTSLNSDSSMPVTPVLPHSAAAVPVVGAGCCGAVALLRTHGAMPFVEQACPAALMSLEQQLIEPVASKH